MSRPIVATYTLRRQWDEKPCYLDGVAVSLDEVLPHLRLVTDFTDYLQTPRNGAEIWEHPRLPRFGFLVKRDELRDNVIALVGKVKTKAADYLEDAPGSPLAAEWRKLEKRVSKLEREWAEAELVEGD